MNLRRAMQLAAWLVAGAAIGLSPAAHATTVKRLERGVTFTLPFGWSTTGSQSPRRAVVEHVYSALSNARCMVAVADSVMSRYSQESINRSYSKAPLTGGKWSYSIAHPDVKRDSVSAELIDGIVAVITHGSSPQEQVITAEYYTPTRIAVVACMRSHRFIVTPDMVLSPTVRDPSTYLKDTYDRDFKMIARSIRFAG